MIWLNVDFYEMRAPAGSFDRPSSIERDVAEPIHPGRNPAAVFASLVRHARVGQRNAAGAARQRVVVEDNESIPVSGCGGVGICGCDAGDVRAGGAAE